MHLAHNTYNDFMATENQMRKTVLVYIWHVSFPVYATRMAVMAAAVPQAMKLANYLSLQSKE